MAEFFQKQEETFLFYDGEGNKIERKTEVRYDPLTKQSSRLVFDPGLTFTLPDYTEAAKLTEGKNCPFCRENVFKLTPLFPKEFVEAGRVENGDAIVAPNLFPYSKYNGVTIMTKEHYVRLPEFTEKMLQDAFRAAQLYIQAVVKQEKNPLRMSINWNYLPQSGGSIIHPHLHVIVSEAATNYQALFDESAKKYHAETSESYLPKLYAIEKENGERFIGEYGDVAWVHAYSPKGFNDYLAIFQNCTTIDDITEQDWADFAKGLRGVFATLTEQGLAGFNMVLSFSDAGEPVHVRLIPRQVLNQLGTSDFNFFQSLHQEALVFKTPEQIAEMARANFKA